ncbi:MAG: transcription elongation factor GreAB [Idiomarina sp.]|jgi:regulator of nucleoside diphosphate kinase|uniref:Regulator of nucleoside diphosphate kinase n=1 Tax=Idiomarina aquatica TaxID=1327752 RepID=A0A4R6PMP2_9GAMM|nr:MULTISPECIES: GreA/GreB family elongation factor [Idiomarina]MBL4742661.1 GreA/GreB family elongation factor [Idiomarina sp.]MBT41035.1 transcription elongation factor GreAB [Idiomarina sp.]PHQ75425.1 MAG: transcription elongation factor GreAB [Idiomarina sp.]TDP39113.1 regulator of nucleoside diphosphate kinase [Idiomarina aquatica]HAD47498.1 transcription elongation factor GreAB [Idiomarina sp.]
MQTKPKIMISTFDLAVIEHCLDESRLPRELLDELEAELARAEVVTPAAMPDHVARLNKQVTFKVLETGKVFTKTLTAPDQVDKYEDSLSVFAPLGAALIGLSIGQTIEWQTNRGKQSVEVIHVS